MKLASLVVLLIGMMLPVDTHAGLAQDNWAVHMQAGHRAIGEKRYSDAEESFRQALRLTAKFNKKDTRIPATLIRLAESLSLQSRQDEAEVFARESILALDRALKAPIPRDLSERFYRTESSVVILDKAADILIGGAKHSEAEPPLKRVIALREEALRPSGSDRNEEFLVFTVQAVTEAQAKLASACDRLASLYMSQRRYAEAERIYTRSLDLRRSRYGDDTPPVATSLSNLATLHAAQGSFEKAEPLYERAVRIFERSDWLDKPELITTVENYALLLRRTGREAEAEALLIRTRPGKAPDQR